MIRLTWRLARPNVLSSIALLLLLVLYAVLTRRAMTGYLHDSGLTACLLTGDTCREQVIAFDIEFNGIINSYALVALVPMFAGVFWGAPLISRELEESTHRLAWTQSISRARWLVTKLAMFLGGALLLAAVTTAVMTWWFRPIENLRDETGNPFGPFEPNAFALRGVVPIAGALLAFAIGAAAGTFFRRGLVAIVVTVVAYLPVLALLPALRAHYRPARTVSYPFRAPSPRSGYRDWILSHDLVDKAGQATQRIQVPDACRTLAVRAQDACVARAGYHFVDTYQPISRFWPFQLIESGLLLAASAVLLGAAAWWVVRKLA